MDAAPGQVPAALAAALADRYRLEREIGAGGMATVFLAHDLKHDRDAAGVEGVSMIGSGVVVKPVSATGIGRDS